MTTAANRRGRHRFALVATLTALVVMLGLVVGVGPASAASASSTPAAPVVVKTAYTTAEFVSNAYLAVHPAYLADVAHVAAAAGASPSFVTIPASHYGCSYAVCIDVVGHSQTVTQWNTDVVGNYGCITAFFDVRHGQGPPYIEKWAQQICSGGSSGVYIAYWSPVPENFPNGDQLCNGWIRGVRGYACATIKA